MAKELPYFKFEPAEYLTKDVSFCSLSAQGLFINICSYYWQRGCKLTKQQLLRRLNYQTELDELISENIIVLTKNDIIIDFLDAQLNEVKKTSKTNSINGSKGGRPKKIKPKETENKPTALFSLSETKGIREDKIIQDKINISKEYTQQQFLKRWKDARLHFDKKPTNISKLKSFDVIKFEDIKKTYSSKQIEQAMQGFFSQDTFKSTRLHPSHFLELENFEKYLTCFETGEKLFDNKKYVKLKERI